MNFFQPSFKLAEKHREGAMVSKRYHPPQTPYERLLQAERMPDAAKDALRDVAAGLDPLKLLDELRAVQGYRRIWQRSPAATRRRQTTSEPPDLVSFVAGLSSAWRAGEIRPTFSIDGSPRFLRGLQPIAKEMLSL